LLFVWCGVGGVGGGGGGWWYPENTDEAEEFQLRNCREKFGHDGHEYYEKVD